LLPVTIFDAIPAGKAGIGRIAGDGVWFGDLDLVVWI
jgi:hypothetical protein